MKRFVSFVISILIIMAAFGGCDRARSPEISLEALAAELLESGAFTDLLSPLDADMAAMLYELDAGDIGECALYCSTGATAEEIALFLAADEQAAARIAEAVSARLEHQVLSYESYVPEELPKLKAAVVRKTGLFVLLCVSADAATAESIIDGYL